MRHKLLNPPHGADPGAGAFRVSASAQQATPTLNEEVVLHNFASPPHGAYPANGVIRDEQGNLYGTTNGAYSDVPGGGTNNAGLVFKLDPSGNETVLYSFTGGADGSSPNGLILDPAGNLYGTTACGAPRARVSSLRSIHPAVRPCCTALRAATMGLARIM